MPRLARNCTKPTPFTHELREPALLMLRGADMTHLGQAAHARANPAVPQHHSIRLGPVCWACHTHSHQSKAPLPRKYVCVTREALTECDGLGVEEGELECLEEVINAVVLVRESLHLCHANRAATESHGSVSLSSFYNALSLAWCWTDQAAELEGLQRLLQAGVASP